MRSENSSSTSNLNSNNNNNTSVKMNSTNSNSINNNNDETIFENGNFNSLNTNDHNNDNLRISSYCTLRPNRFRDDTTQNIISNRNDIASSSNTTPTATAKRYNDPNNYCTMSKKLKRIIKSQLKNNNNDGNDDVNNDNDLPYQKLNESQCDLSKYGLSNDLSTESIKNACDCYDEFSDDDKNNVNNLNKKQINLESLQQQQVLTNYKSRQQKSSESINKYLLEKLENRLADLNSNNNNMNIVSPLTKSSSTVGTELASGYVTMDRKKNHLREPVHPYCTLRRELSSNNNSNHPLINNHIMDENLLLNNNNCQNDDIFKSITNNESIAEAFNILNELDDILENTEFTSSFPSSSSASTRSNTPTTASLNDNQDGRQSLLTICSESDKIEDYLLDLDNYLDEMDRQTPKLFLDDENSINNLNDYDDINNEQNFKRSKTLPKKLKLMKSIRNDNNDNQIKQNNHLLDLEDNNNDLRYNENLRRGHILRNTIAGLRNKIEKAKKLRNCIKIENNVGNCSDDSSSDNVDLIFNDRIKEKISTLPPRKTWRRNSMRKTALLPLPDQLRQHNNQIQSSVDFISSTIETLPSRNENELINNCHEHSQEIETTVMDHHHPESSQELINTNKNTSPNYNSLLLSSSAINNDIRRSLSQDNCTTTTATHQLESLDQLDIINDILNNSTIPMNDSATGDNNRPRQIGRRAEGQPRLISIQTESIDSSGHRRLIINHDRPMSAPAGITVRRLANSNTIHNPSTSLADPVVITAVPITTVDCDVHRFIGSETSSVGSSRNPSPVSLLSSTASSSLASTQHDQDNDTTTTATTTTQIPINRQSPLDPDLPPLRNRGINTYWPHEFSRILALLSCTLGLFNISRFSILTIHYGGNFLLQFLILSIIFGIPMLWLQMCLGSKIKSGPVSMWKISPICRGIGISLCLAQCIIALYSTISLSWVLVYLRDSFVRKNENYLWEESFHIYRRQTNITGNLTETVADYFNGIVLQRWQLGMGRRIDSGGVRFQLAFNLAIIWTAIFLILCKGLKSYGKIVLGLVAIPLVLFITITCKFLYIIDFTTVQNIFSGSDFEDFLINSKTWIAAAQENFLTWALLGPSIISICSRSTEKNPSKKVLRRDAILVVLLTLFGLSLAGIFGYACVQILHSYDYIYLPGSYENMDSYLFLFSYKTPIPPALISIPTKWVPHYSSVLGDMFRRPSTTPFRESGYQPLRLVTELFPAVVAVAQDQISSVWTVIGFLAFLFFGLAHLCAMWKPISNALGNSSSSVLLSCVTGLLLGISFATEMGLSMIHYLDIIIGGAWWILILWTAQILGLFLIRGRPYNGDVLVNDLRMTGSMSAFLALSWNVLLPIGLISLAIIQYKISGSNQFFYWRGKSYFHFWARKLGGLIQVIFLLLVPFTSIIQIYRYLSSGPPDILDRIQLLYRPTASPLPHRRNRTNNNRSTATTQQIITGDLNSMETQAVQDDAPPKYTPPPSYTTATGARLAKLLRQSIRRSVRRILGETSRSRPTLPNTTIVSSNNDNSSLPPEYSTVLSNPSGTVSQDDDHNIEIGPRALYNSYTQRTLSLERDRRPNANSLTISAQNHNRPASASNTTDRLATNNTIAATNFTAIDVAQILRTSAHHRHERSASALAARVDNVLRSSSLRGGKNSRSAENLVLNAAPLGQSSAIILNYDNDTKNSENTSVI